MKVCDWMTRNVVTIDEAADLPEALTLMDAHDVRHLVVVDDRRVLGVVSERDLLPHLDEKVQVGEIMTKKVLGVSPAVSVSWAADLMLRNKIGCLPVLEDGEKLVGIITESDVLSALSERSNRENGDEPAAARSKGKRSQR